MPPGQLMAAYAYLLIEVVFLALAFTGHVVWLTAYGLLQAYYAYSGLTYVPPAFDWSDFPIDGVMLWQRIVFGLLYLLLFCFLGKAIMKKVHAKSWAISFREQGGTIKQMMSRRSWLLLFPLAYYLEMDSWTVMVAKRLVSGWQLNAFFIISIFMLGTFARIRIFFLLSSIAFLGATLYLAALPWLYDVTVPNWPYFVFRIILSLAASVSLFVAWREKA